MRLMDDAEAKTKWCPFARPSNEAQGCITTNCMAWRKVYTDGKGFCELIDKNGRRDQ